MEKFLLLLIIGLSFNGNSQTNYTITAGASTWSDNNITIDVGDSVTFINSGTGNHNINGTTATYPFNPESFGMLAVSQNWTYGYRFNTAGTYSFRCDVHSSMMVGTIVVEEHAGIEESSQEFLAYPNPTESIIYLSNASSGIKSITVFDMLGNRVLSKAPTTDNELDLSLLNPGTYLLEINYGGDIYTQRVTKK